MMDSALQVDAVIVPHPYFGFIRPEQATQHSTNVTFVVRQPTLGKAPNAKLDPKTQRDEWRYSRPGSLCG